jgi:hypothetical protein
LLGSVEGAAPSKETAAPEIAGIVSSVSDSMKSMKSWFSEESAAEGTEEMMVGTMPT